MKLAMYVATMIVAQAASGQSGIYRHGPSRPVIKTTSTLVIVPTLVQFASGEPVPDLDATHFRLTDNGIEQKISVEPAERQPVALAVVMQTGGAATSQLQNYGKLDSMLERILGSSNRKVALVTFDSQVEQIWPFPPSDDVLYYFLTHPKGGNHGAAVMDAVKCAIGLLQLQPAGFRRVILLLSQPQDEGSNAHAEQILRGLAETGTAIYSLTFSPAGKRLSAHSAKRGGQTRLSAGSPRSWFLRGPSTSLSVISKPLRENTASTLAALSGGEHVQFQDEIDLRTKMAILADHIHNSYTLTFYPSSHEAGLHIITVDVIKQQTPMDVKARASYWFDATSSEE